MSKQAVTLPSILSVAADSVSRLFGDARAALVAGSTLADFAAVLAPTMAHGDAAGDYPAYIQFARVWRAAYEVNFRLEPAALKAFIVDAAHLEGVTLTDASQSAFADRVNLALKQGLFGADAKRPTSQAPEAKAKAAARAKAAELPAGTVETWNAKAAELFSQGKTAEGIAAASNARKLERAADAASKAAAKAVTDPLRDTLAEQYKALRHAPADVLKRVTAMLAPIVAALPKDDKPAAPAPIPTSTLTPAAPAKLKRAPAANKPDGNGGSARTRARA